MFHKIKDLNHWPHADPYVSDGCETITELGKIESISPDSVIVQVADDGRIVVGTISETFREHWKQPAPPPTDALILTVDPARLSEGPTGIYVRAKGPEGRFGTYDIFDLTKESLTAWLKSRGGNNEWAENTVLILLGHGGS